MPDCGIYATLWVPFLFYILPPVILLTLVPFRYYSFRRRNRHFFPHPLKRYHMRQSHLRLTDTLIVSDEIVSYEMMTAPAYPAPSIAIDRKSGAYVPFCHVFACYP